MTNTSWLSNTTTLGVASNAPVRERITTQTLLDLCGAMDAQALLVAGAGLTLTITLMLYLGRWRHTIEEPKIVAFWDKLLLTLIGFCFVIIIVRLSRAG